MTGTTSWTPAITSSGIMTGGINSIVINGFSTVDGTIARVDGEYTVDAKMGIGLAVKPNEGMSPKLYFKYMKKKFTEIQVKTVKSRIDKLYTLIAQAEITDQRALYEEYCRLMAIAIREQEVYACGIHYSIKRDIILKFASKVKDKVIRLKLHTDFPRVIPPEALEKFLAVRERVLFDEYWILYTDYVDETLKTNKKKIIEKDPILFGCFAYAPENLYPIVDWQDEYCDLKISDLVDAIKKDEIGLPTPIPEIDDAYCEKIKLEVKERMERLRNTNPSNWRGLAVAEEIPGVERKTNRFGWLKFWEWGK